MEKYKCKYCGKEFDNPRSIGGHTTFCKKNPNIERNLLLVQAKGEAAAVKNKKQRAKENSLNHKQFYTFVCEKCGKEFTQELKLKDYLKGNHKRFCSSQCANSHPWVKEKTKEFVCIDCGVKIIRSNRSNPKKVRCDECKKKHKIQRSLSNDSNKRICVICGKEFYPKLIKGGFSKSKTCSEECARKWRSDNSKKSYLKLIHEDRFKGWMSRSQISYAEQFWIKVLNNNNISFIHEYKVDKYFLDFYIEKNGKKLDLEIDGKQHLYPERVEADIIRDIFLKERGYIVYRIPWNKMHNDEDCKITKEKINKFLEFYNQL